jgi:hypothetical protein
MLAKASHPVGDDAATFVPPDLKLKREGGRLRDPDHQDPLTRGHPCADLNRPPKLQDVNVLLILLLFLGGRPSGNSFFVNGHDLDFRRNYSLPSARHTVVDDPTEGKLEHDIAGLET